MFNYLKLKSSSFVFRLYFASTLFFLTAGLGLYSANRGIQATNVLYNKSIVPSGKLNELKSKANDSYLRIAGFLADQLPGPGAANSIEKISIDIEKEWSDLELSVKGTPLEKDIINLNEKKEMLIKILIKTQALLREDNKKGLISVAENDWPIIISEFINPVKALSDESIKNVEETVKKVESESSLFLIILYFVEVFAVIIAIFYFYFIHQAVKKFKSAFTSIVDSNNLTYESLQGLREIGTVLSDTSNRVAANSEESVASIEELNSIVNQNSSNATAVAQLSKEAESAANVGKADSNEIVTAMSEIELFSHKIEKILHVIDDIAFQTNLLALNAAVEAARAGEQGKGFAVVAEAVRSLSAKSTEATKNISNLIKESVVKIQNGSKISARNSKSISDMLDAVQKVSALNVDIARASKEQLMGINQISKAMTQVDQNIQGVAQSANTIRESTDEIAKQSHNMKSQSQQLTELFFGKNK